MSKKNNNLYLYTKEVKGPKRDTSGEINRFELEQYVASQINGVMSMEEILNSRPFTRDELRIVKLIIAKYAYLAGNKTVGDRIVTEVEKSKDKGSDVFFYLEQVKKNKKLYAEKARHVPMKIKIQ